MREEITMSTPKAFYPYTSRIMATDRIFSRHCGENEENAGWYKSTEKMFLQQFKDAGIKAWADNKIVFEFEDWDGNVAFFSFYDWTFSIGTAVKTDHHTKYTKDGEVKI